MERMITLDRPTPVIANIAHQALYRGLALAMMVAMSFLVFGNSEGSIFRSVFSVVSAAFLGFGVWVMRKCERERYRLTRFAYVVAALSGFGIAVVSVAFWFMILI